MKRRTVLMLIILANCFILSSTLSAQPINREEKMNVALFVPNGAELLDFAGPGEVFSNAGFNTYVIGFTEEPFVSQGFMKVVPNYSYKNCPKPDIIMIPGGGGNNFYQNPEVVEWVKEQCKEAMLFTVCTGAIVAAKGGMLDNLKVTTHYSGYDMLEKTCKNCEVLRDARFVDNDRIITTAGISAGIDGALYLVARIKGMQTAKEVAYFMMYDKWVPEAGLIAKKSAFLQEVQTTGLASAKTKFAAELKTNKKPFAGELSMLAQEYVAAKDYKNADATLNFAIGLYPYSSPLYEALAGVYKAQGKDAPPTQKEFIALLMAGKIDQAIATYEKVKKQYPNWLLFEEDAVNIAGYQLMNKGQMENALKVLELNVKAYPDSFNTYDSLGELQFQAGITEKAKWNLKKSLELNPKNTHAEELLAKMDDNK